MKFNYDDNASSKPNFEIDLSFPTPIYSTILNPSEEVFNQMLSSSISQGETMDQDGLSTGDNTGSYTIHNNSEFYWLNEQIKNHTEIYLNYLGVDTDLTNIYAQKSWIVHCDSNSRGVMPHIHNNCLLSAVYYLQYDKKSDGGILNFHGTSPILQLPIRHHKKTKFTLKSMSFIPKVNKLIIFPSNISHFVSDYISKDKTNRISVTYDLTVAINTLVDNVEGWILDPSLWKKL